MKGPAWLILPALLACVCTACSGTTSIDPVAQAADKTGAQGAEHVRFTGAIDSGLTHVSIAGNGDFQDDPQVGQLTVGFRSGSRSGTMREVVKSWTVYLTSSLFTGSLPEGKRWLSLDLQKAGKAAGVDFSRVAAQTPGQTLDQLRAGGRVTTVGTPTLSGVRTTHYRVIIDPSKLPDGDRIERLTHVQYGPVEVFVSSDGLVRRVHIVFSEAPAEGTLTYTTMTMDFSRYGESVRVPTPPAVDTFDETDAATELLHNGG
jgi:hypothetical protein